MTAAAAVTPGLPSLADILDGGFADHRRHPVEGEPAIGPDDAGGAVPDRSGAAGSGGAIFGFSLSRLPA